MQQNNNEKSLEDIFEEKLAQATNELKKCQNKHNFESCMNCDKIFNCNIRKNYVNAVFNSMSKGQNTDFNF